MSKELVVSSTRHETRVALVEDDQVVELYYQREKEYSLAGSIHKGRVTRVLPGMQSAFVDIGLERDAFLYVSDFFEDNDEYDKVVSSVEDKVLKLDKGNGAVPAAVPPVEAVTSSEPAVATETAPPAEAQPAVTAPEPRTEFRGPQGDNRGDRRGHRSRRRRPRGGRGGIPESKYFSPRARTETPLAEVAEAVETGEEFPVLPGESLAKYGSSEDGPPAGAENEPETPADVQPEFAAVAEPVIIEREDRVELVAVVEPEPEPELEPLEPELQADSSPEEPQAITLVVEDADEPAEPEPMSRKRVLQAKPRTPNPAPKPRKTRRSPKKA